MSTGITAQTMHKGTMEWCLMAARDGNPSTEDLQVRFGDLEGSQPIYDWYRADGKAGWAFGKDSLSDLSLYGQPMIVQQRSGTGALA